MEISLAALGDDADLPAGCPSVLGVVVRRQNLDFLRASASATPMLVPFERVRTATAPSYVIRLSCVREPLMFSPPVVRSKLNCASAPLEYTGFKQRRGKADCVRSMVGF